MNTTIHILDKSGRLARFEPALSTAVAEVLEKIETVLTLPMVDIVIVDSPKSAIPETGVGGNAYTPHFVLVSINPDFPNLAETIDKEIKSTLAHELHHCARMSTMNAYDTLLEACITEGLADHFDREINGTDPKPWSVAVQGEELSHLMERARKEFDERSYDYFGWFFGSTASSLPRWGGYSIGFALVGSYLKRTGKKASELTGISLKDFI